MSIGDELWEKKPSRGIIEDLSWDKESVLPAGQWCDSGGRYPSGLEKYVGKTYFHPKTGHLYMVVGTVFQSEDNRWEVAYMRISGGGLLRGPLFCHRPEDFDREGRFMEVKK